MENSNLCIMAQTCDLRSKADIFMIICEFADSVKKESSLLTFVIFTSSHEILKSLLSLKCKG